MPKIILSTLNARYIHSALGLRYLLANMGELENSTAIREFTLETRPADLAERLLAEAPEIIGFGVYIWNIEETTRLVALLKALAPEVTIVLGGPEVSHECGQQPIVAMADHVITGQADLAFAALCRGLLDGDTPAEKIIRPALPDLKSLDLPYRTYTDEDIANRVIYVEASRGCPFKCEFCLSALDKTSWPFQLPEFLREMALLHGRGVRHFKFVDRTFNLDLKSSIAILEFFLDRLDETLFLHFEVIPDRLPEKLKSVLQRFPQGTLQLEVGVQSFNPEVQTLISRKQDNEKSCENLRWLREESNAHLHTDLIIG
ncbi:MAG: radical SAM protein, partial [Sedimenticola sp.]